MSIKNNKMLFCRDMIKKLTKISWIVSYWTAQAHAFCVGD